jgi:hypothetical protein
VSFEADGDSRRLRQLVVVPEERSDDHELPVLVLYDGLFMDLPLPFLPVRVELLQLEPFAEALDEPVGLRVHVGARAVRRRRRRRDRRRVLLPFRHERRRRQRRRGRRQRVVGVVDAPGVHWRLLRVRVGARPDRRRRRRWWSGASRRCRRFPGPASGGWRRRRDGVDAAALAALLEQVGEDGRRRRRGRGRRRWRRGGVGGGFGARRRVGRRRRAVVIGVVVVVGPSLGLHGDALALLLVEERDGGRQLLGAAHAPAPLLRAA